MPIPSLIDQAAFKLAYYLSKDVHNEYDFMMREKESNQVFHMIVNRGLNFIVRQIQTKFNLTDIHFYCLGVTRGHMECIRRHKNIESLNIDNGLDIPQEYFNEWRNELRFDLIGFLDDCLHPNCRWTLKYLDIRDSNDPLRDNWPRQLRKKFPNLQTLDLQGDILNANQFSSLCVNNKQLKSLNVGFTDIPNLNGIEYLHNLQYLALQRLEFSSAEDVSALFLLKQLRVLNISHTRGMISKILGNECRTSPIIYLDCSNTEVSEEQVRALAQMFSKLIVLEALETPCSDVDFSDLGGKVLNLATVESTMTSLRIVNSKQWYPGWSCTIRLAALVENLTVPIEIPYDEFLTAMMRTYECDAIEVKLDVRKCLRVVIQYLFNESPEEFAKRFKARDLEMPLLSKWKWAAQIALPRPEEKRNRNNRCIIY
uniref:FTH domain-containing protein n=1 Tax=Caenorhabditis tropicalis TaxID=1561998 RepID=A0A1I7UIG0_9PELO